MKGEVKRMNKKALEEITAVDEGGPTAQFISDFCLQLSSLAVMLELGNDTSLQPFIGCEVEYKGRCKATIIQYDVQKGTATILTDNREEVENVERHEFIVKKVPIKLFDVYPSGIFPERDDFFHNSFERYKKYEPRMDTQQIEAKARLYFEAVGRFFLHIMADGRNPIPASAFPEMLRNGE